MKKTLMICAALAFVAAEAKSQSQPAAAPVTLTRAQFASLKWLEGRWRGSGGNYPAFYEEYRFKSDTTVDMTFMADSAAAKIDSRGRIVWTPTAVLYLHGADTSLVTAFEAKSLTFTPRKRGAPFKFTSTGDGAWTANVGPGGTTVYRMTRIVR